MSHRKRRETKQQPSMLPGPAVPGCCLVSFCFLCDIHSIHSIEPDPIFIPVVVRRPMDLLKLERLRAEKKYEVALNRVYILRAVRPSVQTRVSEGSLDLQSFPSFTEFFRVSFREFPRLAGRYCS